jgi:CheY-like chemotaxis protein
MHSIETALPHEALKWIASAAPFDVAVFDMQMPDMDGVTLALEARKHRSPGTLPLVLLSSIGSYDVADMIQDAGFMACLTKPIKASQLFNVLISIFAGQPVLAPQRATQPIFDANLGERMPLRILLAEDLVINQKFALLALQRMGYRADVAANGLEVLDALNRQQYDLILMDVQMPEMDGLATTRHIRRTALPAAQPRIVAMTANAMQGDRDGCLAAGMNDYISKPVQIDELRRVLEETGTWRAEQDAAADDSAASAPAVTGNGYAEFAGIAALPSDEERTEFVAIFLEEATDLVDRLRGAVEKQDADMIRRNAHSLKGSSSYLGAEQLATLSAELEQRGRAGEVGHAAEVFAQLEAEFARVRQALDGG